MLDRDVVHLIDDLVEVSERSLLEIDICQENAKYSFCELTAFSS